MLPGAGEEHARIGPLYTPAQPITVVTPPSESLLIMAVSEEGYVWQWDMPLQVGGPSVSLVLQHFDRAPGVGCWVANSVISMDCCARHCMLPCRCPSTR